MARRWGQLQPSTLREQRGLVLLQEQAQLPLALELLPFCHKLPTSMQLLLPKAISSWCSF
jgi:hypothetical protein